MKKIAVLLAVIFSSAMVQAQKVAYVDVDYVLSNIPEYTDAQKRIDDLAAQWQKEIDAKYAEIDKLYKQYQAEQVLLTEEMKQQRQKEIQDKEKAAKELQKKRFGYEGDLFQKRQELIQPVQDKVYDAIQKIANTKQYDFVLDKSSGSVVLFANAKLNISDQVLQSMGITAKKTESKTQTGGQQSEEKPAPDGKEQPVQQDPKQPGGTQTLPKK